MATSKNTSPFATSFKSAINRGTPCGVAVENIAKRTGKTPTVIFNSLFKAGCVDRQKINGQFVYWPCEVKKAQATSVKSCQADMWQCFVDWCIMSGNCTPQQLTNNRGTQVAFMKYCRKFFNKQFTTTTTAKKKSSSKKSRTTRTSSTKRTYAFPGRTTSRRAA